MSRSLYWLGSCSLAAILCVCLQSCGGGGSSDSAQAAPVSVRGRLVDGSGGAVQATVILEGQNVFQTTSAADGSFSLSATPGSYSLRVEEAGRLLFATSLNLQVAVDLMDLQVKTRLTGVIVGGSSEPRAGALVAINTSPEIRVTTDAMGRFFAEVPAGTLELQISIANVTLRTLSATVPLGPEVDLGALQVLTRVEGLILGGSGTPLSGALIEIDDPTRFAGVTDANGRFQANLPDGTFQVTVRRGSDILRQFPLSVARPGPIALGALTVLGAITGQLFDGLLQPLSGAAVRVDTTPPTIAFADSLGRFAIDVPRGNYTLEALVQGAPTASLAVAVTDFAAVDVGVVQALVRAFGRVLDANTSLPIVGAEVSIDVAPPVITSTGTDGRFAIDLPVNRTSQLAVRRNGIVVASAPLMPIAGTGSLLVPDLLVNPEQDSDQDGLADAFEVGGYNILVNFDGLAMPTLVQVSSNPNLQDSDQDGLSDSDEFINRTNPSRADTDGDGLNDFEELRRYRSNPVHVDSDGDSIPALAGPGQLPDPLLFDGNEVQFSRTSPILADTDGDGLDDGTEVTGGGFRPLVADVPSLNLEIVGDPIVTLNARFNGMTGQTVVNTSLQRDATTNTQTDASINRTTSEMTTSIGGSGGVSFAPPGGNLGVSANVEWKEGVMSEQSSTFTRESVREVQTQLQTTLEMTESISYEDAELTVAVRVRNTSPLSFLLRNMDIIAFRAAGGQANALQVIGSLGGQQFSGGNSFLLPPGGSTTFTATNDALNWQAVLPFVENPTGLSFQVGSFEMLRTDLQGNITGDYSVIAQSTVERCGLVVIDFGGGQIERHWIATNVERNPDGSSAGITMAQALEILGFAPSEWETAPQVEQTASGPVTGARILTRLRNTASLRVDSAGNPVPLSTINPNASTRSWWVVLAPETEDAAGIPYDFENLPLKSGQRISLVYYADVDADGLLANEEALYGTRDDRADTDGDGLSDFFEVREGWEVLYVDDNCLNTVNPNIVLRERVFSNATLADTDGDGIDDFQESPSGTVPTNRATHPVRRDTDGDLISDAFDVCPVNDPATVSPNLLEQGLILRFLADSNTIAQPSGNFGGDAILQDLSVNGNNATIENYRRIPYDRSLIITPQDVAVYDTTDRFGTVARALFLASQTNNGNNNDPTSAIVIEETFNPQALTIRDIGLSFSIAFWVLPDNTQGRNSIRVLGIHDWAGFEMDSSDRIRFRIPNPSSGQQDFVVEDSRPLPLGVWTFICVTLSFDPMTTQSTLQLWRNGETVPDDGSANTVGRLNLPLPLVNTSLSYLEFGGVVEDGDNSAPGLQPVIQDNDTAFIGAIDDLRIYARSLEPLVVQSLYFENGFFPAPTAAFRFDPATPQAAPLTVNFLDESTGQINIWRWDFGDANANPTTNPNTSTLRNPQHLYTAAGTYTVSLTVEGPGGTSTTTRMVTVN